MKRCICGEDHSNTTEISPGRIIDSGVPIPPVPPKKSSRRGARGRFDILKRKKVKGKRPSKKRVRSSQRSKIRKLKSPKK